MDLFTEKKNSSEFLELYNENRTIYVKCIKEELILKGKKEISDYKNSTYKTYLENPEKYAKGSTKEHLNYLKNKFPKQLKWSGEEIYNHQKTKLILKVELYLLEKLKEKSNG